ncbi:MAG: hypothetical protein LBI41_00660 [Lactobacillales bacterium]|nr:hypothetical protein [Lactobacillales bacterium]
MLKGKICVLLLSVSCIFIFFSNLTLAAPVITSYNPWNDLRNGNGWFVEQGGGMPWCRITCSKIVLWDIVQKTAHGGHVINGGLINFFFPGAGGAALAIPVGTAPVRPAAGGAANFDEVLMGSVFASGQGKVYKKNFNGLSTANKFAFKAMIGNFLNTHYGHLNPACPAGEGCNCIMPPYMWNALNALGNEENLLGFFDAMLRIPPPRGTLSATWNTFNAAAARELQGMFFGNSEQAVDQEMNNICGVTGAPTPVTLANSGPSWAAIRGEIVNNHRMVIVTFVNPANLEEAHSCVAFAADNVAGSENIWLYNPWGNTIPVAGADPGVTHNIANGLVVLGGGGGGGGGGVAPVNWDICQYTTFNY